MCGGIGSRLFPLTKSVNKQLLPVYNKPMFFYPLSVLMLGNIRNIMLVVNVNQKELFQNILGNAKDLGIKISYKIQKKSKGIAECFTICKDFIKNDDIALILGDNFFYGSMLTPLINKSFKTNKGSSIFVYPSKNTSSYGVVETNSRNEIIKIIEKPINTNSDKVVTGLYLFDKNVVRIASKIKPSTRGELEITDVLEKYNQDKKLNMIKLGRGSVWLDVGSFEDLFEASSFIQNIEKRQNYNIACLEEISFKKGWINKKNILNRIKFYGNSEYSKYLKSFL